MRVAISSDGSVVSLHFGRCPTFTIVDIQNSHIIRKEVVNNPGHQPGFIPMFLHNKGVEYIITGGMGMKARELFDNYGIKAILGVSGNVEDIINEFKEGKLKSGESLCQPGSGKGYGVEKTQCDHEID